MKIWYAKDMLVHEYGEFEWEDFKASNPDMNAYLEQSVNAAKDRGARYFNVLVKPEDDLLSDTQPNNPYMIDIWRWDARLKATEFVKDVGGETAVHNTALLALLAHSLGATLKPDPECGALRLYVPIRGLGILQCRVPERMACLFNLPEETKDRKDEYWNAEKLVETVFLLEHHRHG